ncbi:hypothetical protein MMC22_010822 [Lobaria immixta]|nr:hypothetical protein [Lobaria immixta]
MDPVPFTLTFGVELEFIASYNPADYEDQRLNAEGKVWTEELNLSLQQKYGILVRMHTIQILNESGFPTNGYEDTKGYENTDFSKWTVDTDGTVTSVETSGNWEAIELKTPIFRTTRAALEIIERVAKLLVSKFRVFTNEKCGLHVHVGNEDRGFDLPTLKTFCSLITVFERQLESLHPPNRVQNPYAKSVRETFNRGATLTQKLLIIDKLETVQDLIVRSHRTHNGDCNKYMAYNFFNLQEGFPDLLQTIEFRQHRGTLDPKLITNWITVACDLVNISYTNKGGLRELIDSSRVYSPNYTVINLFKDLQLWEQAEFYASLVFPQYGTYQNPAVLDESMEDDEPAFLDIPSPGQYDTAWEKEFAPRPPCELTPCKQSPYADTYRNYNVADNMEIWSPAPQIDSEPDDKGVVW